MKSFYFVIGQFLLFLLFSRAVELNSNSTGTWALASAPKTNWVATSSDGSGRNIAAVSSVAGSASTGLYLSTDFGKTFQNIFINGVGIGKPFTGVAIESYGNTIYALQQDLGVYVSTNGGFSFTRTIIDKALTYANYNSVACSGDGSTAFVTLPSGGIYYTRNVGYSFTKSSAPADYWWTVATMSTGQFAAAVSDYLYYSTNYGSSWTKANAPAQGWYSVHLSSNGQMVVAAAGGNQYSQYKTGGIYTSTDYGKNYVVSSTLDRSLDWRTVTSDYTGRVIAAAVSEGDVYYSTDYGKTYQKSTTAPTGENWRSITCDTNGASYTLTSMGSSSGNIYYSTSGI